jgi:hypothetical protein
MNEFAKQLKLIQKYENRINHSMTLFLDSAEKKKWKTMNKRFVLLLRSAGSISKASKDTGLLFHDMKLRGIALLRDLSDQKITVGQYIERLNDHFLKLKVFLIHAIESKKREIAGAAIAAKQMEKRKEMLKDSLSKYAQKHRKSA